MPEGEETDEPTPEEEAAEDVSARARPALDVPSLGAWWIVAGGIVGALLLVLTDHVLRATALCGATLAMAAVLRVGLSPERAGGIVVRSRVVDTLVLVVLAGLVLVSGFTLDLSPR